MMKAFFPIALFYLLFQFFVTSPTLAQSEEEVIDFAQTAIESGSAKELIKYMHSQVELGFGENRGSYGKSQAEFVLRDFFTKSPPRAFEYVHKGASKEGLRYVIGKYTTQDGTIYRSYMLIKTYQGSHAIETLDFTKE
jgi:hypothetical protein